MFQIYRKGEDGQPSGPPAPTTTGGFATEADAQAEIDANRKPSDTSEFLIVDDGLPAIEQALPDAPPPPQAQDMEPPTPSGQRMLSDPFHVYRKDADGNTVGEPVGRPSSSRAAAQKVLENVATALDVGYDELAIVQDRGSVPYP
jgi:hypothetical protein